jgi:hypothetical protein
MKKLLTLALSVVSIGFVALPANAKAAESPLAAITANAVEPQIRITIGRNRNRNRNRRARVVTQTRVVRYGREWYRETIQIKYLPNGRTETRVISRVRVRRY